MSMIRIIFNGNPAILVYHNAPVLTIIAPFAFIIWLAIFVYEKVRKKSVGSSEQFENVQHDLEQAINESLHQLDVPLDVPNMDFLGFRYKVKDDQIKIASSGGIKYVNFDKKVFVENKNLYIADIETKVEIPLDAFTSLTNINKRITIFFSDVWCTVLL